MNDAKTMAMLLHAGAIVAACALWMLDHQLAAFGTLLGFVVFGFLMFAFGPEDSAY